ncbi:16S rRNA (cytosine(1402)-N(4))-methyltransferase [Thioclava electrotropha]|uniref:16S rRNA (cytosine(1402)-N(4))-methyltransferase n=1 Tax=Thioclava electrotropha TaxID=1549850 RepID=UPI0023A79308|nr:16S rRNA (cytosine(1402)-N(4))-methyltransferase [Thioclava electrotropha]
MNDTSLKDHWNHAWEKQDDTAVSWFQETPEPSLSLVERHAPDRTSAFVDIGGGASRLVDSLLDHGYCDLTVLDLSGSSLEIARQRLGKRGEHVDWIESDVLAWEPDRRFGIWHDRAAFHFLTAPGDQERYRDLLDRALKPGGLLAVVSFHSLEDRVVKRFFAARSSTGGGGSRHAPVQQTLDPAFEITVKGDGPDAEELAENPRARSARLRVGRRTEAPAGKADRTQLGLPKLVTGEKKGKRR